MEEVIHKFSNTALTLELRHSDTESIAVSDDIFQSDTVQMQRFGPPLSVAILVLLASSNATVYSRFISTVNVCIGPIYC
jgi:hypothetical protein